MEDALTHAMDNYIRDRIIIDSQRTLELARQQDALEHQGLKGRFRELLINTLLEPWLPPTVVCATGTVISFKNSYRSKTQDDILLIDKQISPNILLNTGSLEGVYLRNSVLARIEVKSTLNKENFDSYLDACNQFNNFPIVLDDERFYLNNIRLLPINSLVAFQTAIKEKNTVLNWFETIKDGSISSLCIPNLGFWKLVGKNDNPTEGVWVEYQCQTNNTSAERLAAFTGLTSNTAFAQHIKAQGRDRLNSLEDGVGQYFNYWKPVVL